MDNDFTQDRTYVSSRGPVEVHRLVVTHAVRIRDKLLREHGPGILETPLGRAIATRAGLEGSVATGVDTIGRRGDLMLRDRITGRFTGAYTPKEAR